MASKSRRAAVAMTAQIGQVLDAREDRETDEFLRQHGISPQTGRAKKRQNQCRFEASIQLAPTSAFGRVEYRRVWD